MKKPSGALILSAVAALLAMALPSSAWGRTAGRTKAATTPPQYDITKEVTIDGTVARIVTKPERGMLAGAHVLVTTPSGTVDAHLGTYAMKGANALTLSTGEHIRMLGVMVTVKGRPVLLVRTLQTGRSLFTIRNARGILLRPVSAVATHPEKAAKGGRS